MGRGVFLLAAAALVSCIPEAYLRPAAIQERRDPRTFERYHRDGRVWSVEELTQRLRDAASRGERVIGTARSVLRGTEPTEFQVEILDIMHNYIFPQHDLVFARLLDDNPVVANAGVVSGMSGSPISLDGKVVGALAYRMGSFGKIPFIGITPIEYMMREADRPEETFSRAPARSDLGLVAVPSPILVSGSSPRGAQILEQLLRERGIDSDFVVAPAASGSAVFDPPDALVEGGSIGVQLLGGDGDLTGVGTVTFLDGNRVLAFGHPMNGDGPSAMPITTAVVHEIFAGLSSSFKIASPGPIVGSLVQDRATAICGEIGREPVTVPIRVTLHSDTGGRRELNFRAIPNREWLPMLVDWAVSNAADGYEPYGHDRVVVSRTTLRLAGGREVRWEDVEAGGGGGGAVLIRILTGGSPLSRLVGNEFAPVEIESIQVESEYVPGNRTARIHRMWALTPEVPPGGTARIRVQLRTWRQGDEFVDVEVAVPREMRPDTDMTVTIGGGDEIAMDLPPAASLDDLLDVLGQSYPSTSLVAVTELESFRLLYRGRRLDRLPSCVVAQMAPGLEEEAVLARSTMRTLRDTSWVIRGTGTATVRVKEE